MDFVKDDNKRKEKVKNFKLLILKREKIVTPIAWIMRVIKFQTMRG